MWLVPLLVLAWITKINSNKWQMGSCSLQLDFGIQGWGIALWRSIWSRSHVLLHSVQRLDFHEPVMVVVCHDGSSMSCDGRLLVVCRSQYVAVVPIMLDRSILMCNQCTWWPWKILWRLGTLYFKIMLTCGTKVGLWRLWHDENAYMWDPRIFYDDLEHSIFEKMFTCGTQLNFMTTSNTLFLK
jgi:hypothetical protein